MGALEGGKRAYEHLRRLHETVTAPGIVSLVPVRGKLTDSGEQTVALLMAVVELAVSRLNVALVLTQPDSFDGCGPETAQL